MVHRFPSFEIDEQTREIRAGSRVLAMQPRVFDLLVYLAKNRERVVTKDELLDKIWPDVTVADGSLQRAVSLARAALAEAGAPDVIRTHARRGYRFFISPESSGSTASPATMGKPDAMGRADDAYRRRDWLGFIDALQEVDRREGLSADDLQRWAHAAQYAGRSHDAIAPLERAVAAYQESGDRARAGWVAVHLAQLWMEWREGVLANGWYHRAARLLEHEPPCREQGHLALAGCRMALAQNEVEKALELAERARELGERFNDRDLESLGLVYLGEASLYSGRIREGLAALDEAGASVVANGLSAWAGGLVYCGVIYSCMTRADWQRAGQWTEQFTRWGEDKGIAGYPGLCRLHRAEVLTVRGELDQAEQEVRASREAMASDAPWAEGESWRVTGDILLAKGDFDAARQAFIRAAELGWEAQFELAQLRFAEGDANGAANILARTLAENAWSGRSKRGRALAHYCIAAATAGRTDEARAALAELDQQPDLVSTDALQALTSQARGELAAAEGRRAEAIILFRRTLRAWLEIAAPLAAANARCRLATLLAADGDHESSAMELAAATAAFRRAGAHGLLAQCEKLHSGMNKD